jgi:hypothetical protein
MLSVALDWIILRQAQDEVESKIEFEREIKTPAFPAPPAPPWAGDRRLLAEQASGTLRTPPEGAAVFRPRVVT